MLSAPGRSGVRGRERTARGRGQPGPPARRLPLRPDVPRHRLLRPAHPAAARHRGVGQRHGVPARGHRQPRRGHRSPGAGHRPGRRPGPRASLSASFASGARRPAVTRGHGLPVGYDGLIGEAPPSRAVVIDLDHRRSAEQWWREAAREGALVFADVGWDPQEVWDPARLDALADCYCFLPNAVEAMAYTRTDTPRAAAWALAERVPLPVVTRGADGALAVDAATGEETHASGLPVTAIVPTGAGDVFLASFVTATLAELPLEHRLRFATLCAALAVQQFGGSLAAPGIGDLHDWWEEVGRARDAGDEHAAVAYEHHRFLPEFLPDRPERGARRAEATFALDADL